MQNTFQRAQAFRNHDDVNRSLVCECSDVIKGLQLMIETSGVSMRQKHLVCHIACEKETLGSCCFGFLRTLLPMPVF